MPKILSMSPEAIRLRQLRAELKEKGCCTRDYNFEIPAEPGFTKCARCLEAGRQERAEKRQLAKQQLMGRSEYNH